MIDPTDQTRLHIDIAFNEAERRMLELLTLVVEFPPWLADIFYPREDRVRQIADTVLEECEKGNESWIGMAWQAVTHCRGALDNPNLPSAILGMPHPFRSARSLSARWKRIEGQWIRLQEAARSHLEYRQSGGLTLHDAKEKRQRSPEREQEADQRVVARSQKFSTALESIQIWAKIARANLARFRQEYLKHLEEGRVEGAKDRKEAASDSPEIVFSPDYRIVTLMGKDFHLTEAQAEIVKILDEAHRTGVKELSQEYILVEAGLGSTRLRDVFRSRKEVWQALLVRGSGRDMYRLDLGT